MAPTGGARLSAAGPARMREGGGRGNGCCEAGPVRCWATRDRVRAVACARKEGSWAGGCQGNGLRAESEEEMERKEEIPFFFLFLEFFKSIFQMDLNSCFQIWSNQSSQE